MKHIKYLVLLILLLVSSVSCFNTITNVKPESSIFDYAASGDLAGVQECIESGIDVNATTAWADKADNTTALMLASHFGHLDVVKYLVETGKADTKLTNIVNQTALDLATLRNHTTVMEYLKGK